jgi:branched-chain amino acid transport system permease protein
MQFLVNSIIAGSGIALIAIGFSLIYSTTRFFHFAHGAVYMVGGYSAYALITLAGWPSIVSVFVAMIVSALAGCLIEACVYRPLRKRSASPLVLLLASIGLFVALQNVISACFGNSTIMLRTNEPMAGFNFLGGRITAVQLGLVLLTSFLGLGVAAALRFTKLGKIIRALANDPELAGVFGVSVDRTILCVFAIGSGLAALAAIMIGFDTDLNPMMGLHALLLGVVAAIIGGMGSVSGGLLGALLIGAAQHFGVWRLPTRWQDAIVFAILILFLLFRPQGFFGKPLRRKTV